MQNENARNTIIFVVCTAVILIVYQVFVLQPQVEARHKAEAIQAQQARASQAAAVRAAVTPGAAPAAQHLTRAHALAATARVPITTPSITGSLALTGGRIDDLQLSQYWVTTARKQHVELFTPLGADRSYFAEFGWLGANGQSLPGGDAAWRPLTTNALSPGHPVTLAFDTVDKLSFRRTISVDAKYMFTVVDQVANNSGRAVQLAPYARVERNGLPADIDKDSFGVFQGGLSAMGEDHNFHTKNFKAWRKAGEVQDKGVGGWLGITDKYWLAALAPDPHAQGQGILRVTQETGYDAYMSDWVGAPRLLAAGAATASTMHLFAGAKEADALSAYEKTLGIPKFTNAIDWGWTYILTRPMFWLLHFFYQQVGNFGLAILLLTIVVRGLLFPLANQTFSSGAKMKKLQPKIDELKQRHAKDPQKQQQEMMALWQREKINPVAGCLPILLQIPVFFALVKLLQGTIEMRHAPFLGIHDLSARDPTSLWNLFGLIPYDPAALPLVGGLLDSTLHIGIVALLYTAVMYLQQAMTPVTADPTQQQIMRFMPLFFVFIMARYPVGLMIYWIWSTILSVAQQYWFMHRYKVDNPIDGLIKRLRGGPDPSDVRAPSG